MDLGVANRRLRSQHIFGVFRPPRRRVVSVMGIVRQLATRILRPDLRQRSPIQLCECKNAIFHVDSPLFPEDNSGALHRTASSQAAAEPCVPLASVFTQTVSCEACRECELGRVHRKLCTGGSNL
jgi:hypothetical protein